MHYDYVIAGNVMLDRVIFMDGSESGRESIGGPATFAYSGVRLWTDNVLQCSNVGADWEPLFNTWIEKNHVETKGFKVITDRCNHSIMRYKDKSGAYAWDMDVPVSEEEYWLKNDAWQDFGYMKSSPENIEQFTQNAGVKGVYVAQNADRTFWKKFGAIKKRDGFKLIWELRALGRISIILRILKRYAGITSMCFPAILRKLKNCLTARAMKNALPDCSRWM